MTRFRWFGFAAVVVCASVFLMGCGDSSAPAYDTAPATIDESNTDTCPARPAPDSLCDALEGLYPEPPTPAEQIVLDEEQRQLEENWVEDPSRPADSPEPYPPGVPDEPEEKPCGAGGPAEVC